MKINKGAYQSCLCFRLFAFPFFLRSGSQYVGVLGSGSSRKRMKDEGDKNGCLFSLGFSRTHRQDNLGLPGRMNPESSDNAWVLESTSTSRINPAPTAPLLVAGVPTACAPSRTLKHSLAHSHTHPLQNKMSLNGTASLLISLSQPSNVLPIAYPIHPVDSTTQ